MQKAKVFTIKNCQWCEKAKDLLESRGYEVQMVSVDNQNTRALWRRNMSKAGYGVPSTVPQIFIDDQYIGGYDDLIKHFDGLLA